jgi:glutamine synthetase
MLGLDGVRGLTIAFSDMNGITRSRTVPFARFEDAVERGVGITSLFPVFTSTDGITFGHEPLSTPSGDLRLCATHDRVRRLAGQPAFAWTPGRLFEQDGSRSAYCQRHALERQIDAAAAMGLEVYAGYELEWFIGHADAELSPAHHGPVYGPLAMLEVDEFCAQLLADLDANGILVGQLHAEYGLAQMELAISPLDPLAAADMQLLARQTIHAAARAHGLRASFAPLVTPEAAGNGWHAHSSVMRDGENLLAGGDRQHGLTAEGEAWLAGLVRELPALAAIASPSVPSLLRRRPGYFASAYAFWGVQNREASLRFMPETALVPANAANIELKASDASGNPYLALASIISAGLAGIAEGLTLSDPINVDPGSWTEAERAQHGVALLPTTTEQQIAEVEASLPVRDALGEPLFGAWSAVRTADASWAKGKTADEIVTRHRWSY